MFRNLRLAALLVLAVIPAVSGDVLTLKSGGVFEGKITESEDRVTIETGHLKVTFDTSEVAGIQYGPVPVEVYQARAEELEASNAEGWYQLGIYATGKGLYKLAEEAYQKAVEADPSHEKARLKLGYKRLDGEWVTREEAMRRRGLVRFAGRWVTPEEAEELAAEADARTRISEARSTVRTLTFMITSGIPHKSGQARLKLSGLSDPAALRPLIEEMSNNSVAVRLTILQALMNYREDAAALAALDAAMWDPNAEVRYQARVVLNALQNERAFRTALSALHVDDDDTRFRASEVLGSIGEARAIPYLIKHLYWTRPRQASVQKPRMTRSGRSRRVQRTFIITFRAKVAPGAVGYEPVVAGLDHGRVVLLDPDDYEDRFYDFPVEVDQRILNYSALEALRAMTAADFRFDKGAWRNWYLANAARFKKLPAPAP